jgi:hypothetical protein
MATASDFLSTYIGPLVAEMTPQQARVILATKPSDKLCARVQELADKANLGLLSERERAEYEIYIDVDDVVGLLKLKARSLLQQQSN